MKYTIDFDKLTLKEKILQTFIVSIREINKHGGPEKFFKTYKVGGMFYAQSHDPDIENRIERSLPTCRKRLEQCKGLSQLPLLVCADGVPLAGQKTAVGTRALAGTQNEDDAYNFGKITGMQMNENGIDWVLAPAIDMYRSRFTNMPATSSAPALTARIFKNVVRGIQDQGICATVKHFPGIGTATNINMHLAPSENTMCFDEWEKTYGYTYSEMIKENVCSIMTTHMTLNSYDNEKHDGFLPIATFSEKLTKGLLKEKLGFDGVVVTDALIMGGMATGDLVKETVQAFKAGADFLLWPPVEAADALEKAILSGEIPESRLNDALLRIGKMRAFRETASESEHDTPDVNFANRVSEDIIRRGVCLRRNDIGLIPVSSGAAKVLVLDACDNENTAKSIYDELNRSGCTADIKRVIYDTEFRVCWQDDIDKLQSGYDIVIFAVDAEVRKWGEPMMMIWASHMFDKKKKIIVNFASPFYADTLFPEDPTIVEVNSGACPAAASAVVDGIFGRMKFTGHSSVEV